MGRGARVEDTVLLGADGAEQLTLSPREVTVLGD